MWMYAGSERVAELFHNYEQALGVCGKGSESGSSQESAQSPTNNRPTAPDGESRHYFAQPGEAE